MTARSRNVAVAAAVLLGIVLYVVFVKAIDDSRARLRSSVAALRAEAVKLERDAQEIAQLRNAPLAPAPQSEVRAIVDAAARNAGLKQTQTRVDAKGPDEAAVVLESVSFAAWLSSVASLDTQQVRLETGRIEALSTPGLVSVTATFVRARP